MPIDVPIAIVSPEAAQGVFAALQQQAQHLALHLRPPPPEPTTCCGRGCNGCVWEGFYAAAHYWQEDALAAIASAQTPSTHPTHPQSLA